MGARSCGEVIRIEILSEFWRVIRTESSSMRYLFRWIYTIDVIKISWKRSDPFKLSSRNEFHE